LADKRKPRTRKLTDEQVKGIAASIGLLAETATLYGCSVVTVSNIRRGLRKAQVSGVKPAAQRHHLTPPS
jgi:hypothetical protein